MKRRESDNYFDPIEVERRIRERDEFVANLFHPVYWDGPAWEFDWLVQDLIPIGYLVMLAGPPKCGKTCLATALALSVANGLPFAGRPVHQGGVLWVSAEESPRERHLHYRGSPLVEPSTPLYTSYQRLPVDEERTLNGIRDWVHRTDARLLVVDPLLACAGHSLTDSWLARKSLQELKIFAELSKITVLVIHHQKRDFLSHRRARVADSDQLAATASMNIVLSHSAIYHSGFEQSHPESPIPTPQSSIATPQSSIASPQSSIENQKSSIASPHSSIENRQSSIPPRLVLLDCYGRGAFANRAIYLVSHGPLDYRPTQVEETPPVVESAWLVGTERAIVEVLKKGPRGSGVILAETRRNEGSIRNALTNLRRKGLLKVISIGRNKRIYALTKMPADSNPSEDPCELPCEQPCETPNPEKDVNCEPKRKRTRKKPRRLPATRTAEGCERRSAAKI